MVILSLLGCRYLHRGKENDMGVYKDYCGFETNEKICPLLSLRVLWGCSKVVECLGQKCQWWEFCKKGDTNDSNT